MDWGCRPTLGLSCSRSDATAVPAVLPGTYGCSRGITFLRWIAEWLSRPPLFVDPALSPLPVRPARMGARCGVSREALPWATIRSQRFSLHGSRPEAD